ncbi:MAG: gliding motility-associated C-terminal domain-containing protein [Bacteroidota bacterium]|jgi:gliding motility-associated-like protein
MKKLSLLILLILASNFAFSLHIAGGDLTTKYLGNNNFEVDLVLYRDCSNPQGSPFDQDITIGIFNSDDNTLFDTIHLDLGSIQALSYSGPGCVAPPSVCMQAGTYKRIVQLPNRPLGYYLVWERCCRNTTVVNIQNPSQAGLAFYCSIPDPALQSSSPEFTVPPLPYVCAQSYFKLPFTAVDVDGDSLVYTFTSPLEGGHTSSGTPNPFSPSGANQIPQPVPYTSCSWQPPYSLNGICGTTMPLVINRQTGLAEGQTDATGLYAMAVSVKEYRNGVQIGEIRREIEITAIPCSGNTAPNLSANVINKNYELYAGDNLCFNVTASDPNNDSLFLNYSGEIFANTPNTSIQAPYAVSYDTVGQSSVSTTFCWNTACNQGRDSAYVITYEISDNGCPLPLTSIGKFTILVKPTPIITSQNLICLQSTDNNTIALTIANDNSIINRLFDHFTIYRSTNGGPFTQIGNYSKATTLYDSTANNNSTNKYCYYMTGTNRCGEEGPVSDTLCSGDSSFVKIAEIISVSVTNHNQISITWKNNPDFYSATLHIQRKLNCDTCSWQDIAQLKNYAFNSFTDEKVYTNETSYCYNIFVTDDCGNTFPPCKEQCSILLEGEQFPYEHRLNWTEYINWDNQVSGYYIERSEQTFGMPYSDLYFNNANTFEFIDDNLPLKNGVFHYRIRAEENQGGNNAKSYSNEIELIQKPILFLPNAFSPNEDDLNEVWKAEGAFIKDYKLLLLNRWSQLIFESNSVEDTWNGKYKDVDVPEGVYFYRLRYSGYDLRTVYERLGTITVIR